MQVLVAGIRVFQSLRVSATGFFRRRPRWRAVDFDVDGSASLFRRRVGRVPIFDDSFKPGFKNFSPGRFGVDDVKIANISKLSRRRCVCGLRSKVGVG